MRLLRSLGKRAVYFLTNPSQIVRPQVDVPCVTNHGIGMVCSHENHIERHLLQAGVFEPESTEATVRCLRPGQVVFDVGANVGYYTLLMAKLVGAGGQVHAFEPTTWAYERCQRNLSLNPVLAAQPVFVNRAGLLAQVGRSVDAIESRFSAKVLAYQTREEMSFTTIDRYCAERGIKTVDFIKVDVDGHDVKVLRGARETIGKHRPTLLCEFCERVLLPHQDSVAHYVTLLEQYGYVDCEVLDGPLRGKRKLAELAHVSPDASGGSMNVLLRPA